MIYVPDIIGEIVDSMREKGSYVVSGTSTTTSTNIFISPTGIIANSIKIGTWIEIESKQYKVKEKAGDLITLEITTSTPSNSGSYKSIEPYYLFGHRIDIANRLLDKDQDNVFKYQKYPLIALRLPLTQEVMNDDVNCAVVNIAIMECTEKNYTSEERYDNVIKPVLSPIYERFLLAIENSPYISLVGTPQHKRIDRLFWGTEQKEGNVKYIFNDPLDAIELIDLKLNIIEKNC